MSGQVNYTYSEIKLPNHGVFYGNVIKTSNKLSQVSVSNSYYPKEIVPRVWYILIAFLLRYNAVIYHINYVFWGGRLAYMADSLTGYVN
jgi:hypothetical protein